MNEKKKRLTFDLMVFDNTEDYLCYVEAVHLLMHERIKKECNFILNPRKFLSDIRDKSYQEPDFLNQGKRVDELFFVIDNTDYPEALREENWNFDRKYDSSMDIYVNVKTQSTFTSNDKYFVWTFMFMITLVILATLLVCAILAYCR